MVGRNPALKDKEPVKPHPLQRAWAGGVFDARGAIIRAGYTIRIDAVNQGLIRRFHEIVQYGTVKEWMRKDGVNTIYIWQTWAQDDTREVLKWLAPFLTAQKLKESADMIDKIERSPTWAKRNPEKANSLVMGHASDLSAEAPMQQPDTVQDG